MARHPGSLLICAFLNVETGKVDCTKYNEDIEDYAPFMIHFNRSNFSIPTYAQAAFTNYSNSTIHDQYLVEFNCDFWTGWAYFGQRPDEELKLTYHPYILGCAVDYLLILKAYDNAKQVADLIANEQLPVYIKMIHNASLDLPLGKTFTEAGYGLMAAYRQFRNETYKQAFYRLYDEGFQSRRSDVCYKQYLNGTETLFIGSTMIELDLDAYDLFGNESFREDAFRCTRNLLALKQGNGLIPYIIGENPMTRTEFDAENDFAVVLRKFCYRFGLYCDEAEQLKRTSLTLFEAPYGYYEQLGNQIVDTKYFGAMLKMWMPVNDSYLTRDR